MRCRPTSTHWLRRCYLALVLLLDDDDKLSETPGDTELALAAKLGADVALIDERILQHTLARYMKVARVVIDAVNAGGFDAWDDGVMELHTRRVIALGALGKLEIAGNPLRPRFSEIRLPQGARTEG